jgi:putative DNA primase/helicase
MEETWTSSAISDAIYLEMCKYDEEHKDQIGYATQAVRYANRRAIVRDPQDFTDIFILYINTLSPLLRKQILSLCYDLESINRAITNTVFKIIKSRVPHLYYEYFQKEPLRWKLLDSDGNGRGNSSVIAEYIPSLGAHFEEDSTIIQLLAKSILADNVFKTTTDNAQLYRYIEGIYVTNQEWVIKEQSRLISQKVTTHQIHEVINYVKDSTYIDRSEFDTSPDIINLQNGLLNIHTLELKRHSSDYYHLVQLPIRYDPKAKCPNILRFLGQVLKPRDVFTVLEIIGYCLYRTTKYEKAVLCVGKGSNGKSTFLKIIDQLLGLQNLSHVSLQDLANDRFASAGLYGKLVNTFADLKSDKLSNTGLFKMLVSGDFIRAQNKFCNPFEFRNYAKLIFSANEIPQSEDKSYAYFRRWIILFFENVFEGDSNDIKLIEKLTTDEELSGLLNLALIALRQLIKDNGFIHVSDIATIERDYNLNASTVERFLREKCIVTNDREDYIICRDLWDIYYKFCKDNGLNWRTDNILGMELKQLRVKKERLRINKFDREYCYVGLRLKENA